MKKFLLKSLTLMIAIFMLVGCIVLSGCDKEDEFEYENNAESAQKLIDKAESCLKNAYRVKYESWDAETENELQNMIDSNTGSILSVEEIDGKNRYVSRSYEGAYDIIVYDNMVYFVGEPVPDTDMPVVWFKPMHKYAFKDEEYNDMLEAVFGMYSTIKADYFKNFTITKLDDGKIKLVMSGVTDLYLKECILTEDLTVYRLETELIFDSNGRYLSGSSRLDYTMHYEYGIVTEDRMSCSYTECTYEYDNVKVSVPENADEYILTEFNWKEN